MKKLILFVLCALSGLMVSAQSRWGITPEGGFAAVNRYPEDFGKFYC